MMIGNGQRVKLFRVLGFPVYAEASVLFLVVIYLLMGSGGGPAGIIAALIFVAVAFVSIVIHELGHALMVRRLGLGESTIVLHGMGGVCQWRGSAARKERIYVALAGPGAGLIVGGVVWLLVELMGGLPNELLSSSFLWAWLVINIGWSIFNLMPIWPLDGGHVVRDLMSTGSRSRSEVLKLSLQISMGVGGALIFVSVVFNQIFVAVLLGLIIYNNYRELQNAQGPRQPRSPYGY